MGVVHGRVAVRILLWGAMPARIPVEKKKRFSKRLRDGWNVAEAARDAGVSYAWAKAEARGLRNSSGDAYRQRNEDGERPLPVALAELGVEAARALEDIGLFARRYFGLVLMPWQELATARITDLQRTADEEYVVINVAPGSGKSTFFTLVLPAWITCRQRHIRGMIGSASMAMAKQYVGELRDTLANPLPVRQAPEAVRAGIAVDAEASLVADFGVFKPEDRKWAADAFFVEQHDGVQFRAKEPTWQAFGRGSTFLGARVDFCIWDDVYDPEQMRTQDARDGLKQWWKDVAETRLEPGGLMVLQGQRMDADDIYAFALSQRKAEFIDADDEGDAVPVGDAGKYHHIVFPAHDDDDCKGLHKRSDPAWPEGCLLFPRRLTWRKLESERENNPNFEVVYQQKDVDPKGVLVPKLWVTGGRDVDGAERPGCWDLDRGLGEIPLLTPPFLSIASADPSPTRYWAIQWWIFHPATQQRFLIDLERKVIGADDEALLDFDPTTGRYTGIMESWQLRSVDLGAPISHWVVEINGANRFLLRPQYVANWLRLRNTSIVPHDTNRNKADPKMGVTSIGSHWKYGRVRLPGRQNDPGRAAAAKLVSEVTRYRLDGRQTGTDDCVLAEWFFEFNLPKLIPSASRRPAWRPSWMRQPA